MAKEELVHQGPRPTCGIERRKGLLLSGDVARVTCPGCAGKKAVKKGNK